MSFINDLTAPISKMLFCNRCELCGEVIELDDVLCDECKNPPKITGEICLLCGYKKDDCICKKKKLEYKGIIAPYYYKDSIVKAVLNFKKHDMPFLSKRFSKDILDVINERYKDINFDYITFVPMRHFHRRKRGYNQAELLANDISKLMNIECINSLSKIRNTGVQHYKNERERIADIFGSIDVLDNAKEQINNKTILLIDDVKTTGSTLSECAKMLKIYGANSVYCATLAITKKDKNINKKTKD